MDEKVARGISDSSALKKTHISPSHYFQIIAALKSKKVYVPSYIYLQLILLKAETMKVSDTDLSVVHPLSCEFLSLTKDLKPCPYVPILHGSFEETINDSYEHMKNHHPHILPGLSQSKKRKKNQKKKEEKKALALQTLLDRVNTIAEDQKNLFHILSKISIPSLESIPDIIELNHHFQSIYELKEF